MALRAPDHNRYLAKLDLFCLILLNKRGGSVADSLPLLDVHIDLGVNLVSHVPDPGLMREIRIHLSSLGVFHHGFRASVNLAKNHLVTNVVVVVIRSSCDVLSVDLDHVVLMLLDAISNHVLDEAIEGLNLLVNYSILIEVGIDDFPLVVQANLIVSIFVDHLRSS
jgi:hypothetical protein